MPKIAIMLGITNAIEKILSIKFFAKKFLFEKALATGTASITLKIVEIVAWRKVNSKTCIV